MTVTFTINGVQVEAEAGGSVLDTARRYGFEVPSLCHHEAVVPYGACRMCLTEITRGKRRKITTSCNYEVLPGIEVRTDTPEVRRHQSMVLELILAKAPENKALRDLAARYGLRVPRFARVARQKIKDCILCGLCARVCSESIGAHALTFTGRGDLRDVGVPFQGEPRTCIGCGSCASVCPTSCIVMEDTRTTRKIWDRTFRFVACDVCGGPVMTEEHKEHAIKTAGLPAEYYKTCPTCRQNGLAGHFARVGS
ncbi:MAG: 2Fe-2S iron-sulfur cluster-binding protein [Deltaproteobacteria bacterium]|nr:2Fe-2S iron-sulfur cluster-binding protein [Deltaproteobacteria bacterium]